MEEHTRQTSEVVFLEEEARSRRITFQTPTPKIVYWVINHSGGHIKDKKQAVQAVMIAVIVIIVVSVLIFVLSANSGASIPEGELYYYGLSPTPQ